MRVIFEVRSGLGTLCSLQYLIDIAQSQMTNCSKSSAFVQGMNFSNKRSLAPCPEGRMKGRAVKREHRQKKLCLEQKTAFVLTGSGTELDRKSPVPPHLCHLYPCRAGRSTVQAAPCQRETDKHKQSKSRSAKDEVPNPLAKTISRAQSAKISNAPAHP